MWLVISLCACTSGTGQDTGSDSNAGLDDTACAQAYPVTWENWADGFFATYCRACHSTTTADRLGAPEEFDFDTRGQVRTHARRIEEVVLIEERMPVGGGVYADDLTLLEDYLACGLVNR
jgi:uncharacterized membrane protein